MATMEEELKALLQDMESLKRSQSDAKSLHSVDERVVRIMNITKFGTSWRSKVKDMSAEVVDSNPYGRLMALQRMGIVDNYERIREFSVAIVGMTKTDAAVQTLSEINPDVVLEVQKQNAILPLSCFLLHAWVECGCVFMSGDDEMMTQNSIVQFVNWMIKRYENIKLLQRFGNNEDDILIYQYNTVLQSVG
ncbi:ubiquitin-like modifier-activating enzyme 5 isoform X2 [Elaeis guineensis]|uniref:ubiquitin-like modifier-activating enzyme 5 isoform X2 n=1 Tax=Elaeis guineensis var. tenera TaxID=51953 RepID=UPI003C6CD70F